MLCRRFNEQFSGILVRISKYWAFSLFETVPGGLIRSLQFLSVENRAILKYAQARRICSLKKKVNFWNRLTFLNKHLLFLRSLKGPFGGNSVKLLTAGHLVYLRPYPAATTSTNSIPKDKTMTSSYCRPM